MSDLQGGVQPRDRSRGVIFVALGVIAAVVFSGLGFAGGMTYQKNQHDETTPVASVTETAAPTTTAPFPSETSDEALYPPEDPSPEPSYYTPVKTDFKLNLKTLERQCFGSAGCSAEYRVEVTYLGEDNMDPSATFELSYQIDGDESGPIIGTIELSGDNSYDPPEESVSAPSSSTKVTVKVTDFTEF